MIVVDLETTGLNPETCSIIEYGAVDMNNPNDQFSKKCCIPTDSFVSQQALEVNGQTEEEIRDPNRSTSLEVFNEFIKWASDRKNRTLGGHNLGSFDIQFLKEVAENSKNEWTFGHRYVDLHSVAYARAKLVDYHVSMGYNNTSPFHAGEVYDFVNIPEEPDPHKAVRGAIWESEAFARILRGKSLFKKFSDHSIPDYLKQ